MLHGPPRWQTPALWLLLLLALALRVHDLGEASLWIDEFNSLYASTGRDAPEPPPKVEGSFGSAMPVLTTLDDAPSWWKVWGAYRGRRHGNPHPPLYALMLRFWRELFGGSEAGVRSLSVAWSMVALLLMYDISRHLHGPGVALAATFLMAVAPIQVRYAQETRGYAMGLALLLAVGGTLVRIEKLGPRPRRLVALGFFSLAAALTHYFAIGVLAGLGLFAALRLQPAARRGALVAFALGGLVFVAAWGPFFWTDHVMSFDGFPGFLEPRAGHVTRTLYRLADVPIIHLTAAAVVKARPSPLAIVMTPIVLMLAFRARMTLWLFWGAGALGLVVAHDLLNSTKQLAVIRFTLFASPATYALLAAATAHRMSWRRCLIPAAAVVASLASLPQAYRVEKPAWRELSQTLKLVVKDGDVVLLGHANKNYMIRAMGYYADLGRQYVVVLRPDPPPSVRAAVDDATRAWLVATSPDAVEPFPAWRIGKPVFEGQTPLPSLWSLERQEPAPATQVGSPIQRLRPYWVPPGRRKPVQ